MMPTPPQFIRQIVDQSLSPTAAEEARPLAIESMIRATLNVPLWLWISGGTLLFLVCLAIYMRERGQAPRWIRVVLATLRFCLLALVLWMLMGWMVVRYRVERPEIAIIVDRSASMATTDGGIDAKESVARLSQVREEILRLPVATRNSLSERYRVRWFSLADQLLPIASPFSADQWETIQADGKQTRLGSGLLQMIDRLAGSSSSAILLLSDGINSAGVGLAAAERSARAATVPVYPVLVGNDAAIPDVRLADIRVDDQVFLGDRILVEASIAASAVEQEELKVTLLDSASGRRLDEGTVRLTKNQMQAVAELSFLPDAPNEVELKIQVETLQNELNTENNVGRKRVSIRDRPLRVLLVQQRPNYEFRFLKHLLERSLEVGSGAAASFSLSSVLQESDPEYVNQDDSALRLVPTNRAQLLDFDVFIFGRFDPTLVSRRAQSTIVEAITERGAGCVFIYGNGNPAIELDGYPIGAVLPVQNSAGLLSNPPVLHPEARWTPSAMGSGALPLQLLDPDNDSPSIWSTLPIIRRTCSLTPLKLGAQSLVTAQRADGASSTILISQYAGAGRVVLQANDETYRWTSVDGTDTLHQRYWGQLLRWVSRGRLNQPSEQSAVTASPENLVAGQTLTLEATIGLDIPQKELPNSATVLLNWGAEQRTVKLTPSTRNSRTYSSQVAGLSPGEYRALLVQPATDEPASTEFRVQAPPGEMAELKADLTAMESLATVSRGRLYRIEALNQLLEELPGGASSELTNLPPTPLWNRWWVALLFVALIGSEWLLRRKYRML